MHLGEIHQVGPRTRERIITPSAVPALQRHGIVLAGLSEARAGFSFVRRRPAMAQALAGWAGNGEVWLEGRWKILEPGQAYLTPAGVPHAYRAPTRGIWRVAWVCYAPGDSPLPHPAPLVRTVETGPLRTCLEELHREALGRAEPSHLEAWTALLHLQVVRSARGEERDGRLDRVMEAVSRDLAHPWTIPEMAALAHLSPEHLRRLFHREWGRSPGRHLAHLRLSRAAALLAGRGRKVAVVAAEVGYENPFAFTTAFRRAFGLPPSAYR